MWVFLEEKMINNELEMVENNEPLRKILYR